MNWPSHMLSPNRGAALAAAASLLVLGAVATTPARAAEGPVYGGGYNYGYSDHDWGYDGYYDGYVPSRGAYNDTPVLHRGYPPEYAPPPRPVYYGYAPDYDDPYYYGPPGPAIGVQVGPVGVGFW
ncbi:MAG TPA: hypothetical protein VN632_00390 [Stellaceae bacterium]|nr:hypothetical protein [Stellaceae bacterium]